jgi:hypothetical protein
MCPWAARPVARRSRPRFSASRKCRENAGARVAPQSRVVGSAAPPRSGKPLIMLTISYSSQAAAPGQARTQVGSESPSKVVEMSSRRRPAARRLRTPHDRRTDKSSAASTAYTIGRPTSPPCETGKSRCQRPRPATPARARVAHRGLRVLVGCQVTSRRRGVGLAAQLAGYAENLCVGPPLKPARTGHPLSDPSPCRNRLFSA